MFIDDATSKITTAKFCNHETTDNYLNALKEDLREIFAHKEQKKLSKDLIFQYRGDLHQIKPEMASFGMKHAPVTVINKQGNIEVKYKDKTL